MATKDQAERETAVQIAADFYSGRDGVGPVKLFETAELIRTYIEHGDRRIERKVSASRRR